MERTPALNADLGAWGAHHRAIVEAHEVRNAALNAADRAHGYGLEYASADDLGLADDIRNAAVDAANATMRAAMRAADGVLEAALDATRHARRRQGTV